jgi:hypothetical protein
MKHYNDTYIITDKGQIIRTDIKNFEPDDNWIVFGIVFRPNKNSLDLTWEQIKEKLDNGEEIHGYHLDVDHGTIRMPTHVTNGKIDKTKFWNDSEYVGVTHEYIVKPRNNYWGVDIFVINKHGKELSQIGTSVTGINTKKMAETIAYHLNLEAGGSTKRKFNILIEQKRKQEYKKARGG